MLDLPVLTGKLGPVLPNSVCEMRIKVHYGAEGPNNRITNAGAGESECWMQSK